MFPDGIWGVGWEKVAPTAAAPAAILYESGIPVLGCGLIATRRTFGSGQALDQLIPEGAGHICWHRQAGDIPHGYLGRPVFLIYDVLLAKDDQRIFWIYETLRSCSPVPGYVHADCEFQALRLQGFVHLCGFFFV
jgi:hypothetical protein